MVLNIKGRLLTIILIVSMLLLMTTICYAAGNVTIDYPVDGNYYNGITEFNGTLTSPDDIYEVYVYYKIQRTNDSYYFDNSTSSWVSLEQWNDIVYYDIVEPIGINWTATTLPTFVDGTAYNLSVKAEDNETNEFISESIIFTYDTTPPTVTVTLNDTTPVKAGNVTFTLDFNEAMDTGTNPTVKIINTSAYSVNTIGWTNSTRWTGWYNFTTGIGDGNYTINVTGAKDLAGTEMGEDTSNWFVLDTTNPEATLEESIDNVYISPNNSAGTQDNSTIDVNYTESSASDIFIVSSTDEFIRNLYHKTISQATKNPGAQVWNGTYTNETYVPDGLYKVMVNLTDKAGNSNNNINLANITVDNTNPSTPTITTPTDQIINADYLIVYLSPNSTDDNWDTYQVYSTNSLTWTNTLDTNSTGFNFTLTQDTNNTLYVRGKDLAGNLGANASTWVLEDSTPPEAYFTDPPTPPIFFGGAEGDIVGYANDTNFNNWSLELYQNGIFNRTLCSNTTAVNGTLCIWNTSIDCLDDECENFTIILNATDSAGNYNYSSQIQNITIDNIPPEISNTMELVWGESNQDVTAKVNISDTYLYWVNAYLFNETNYTVVKWVMLSNETEQVGSGTFNTTWAKEIYSLNNTSVSAHYAYCLDCILVPGCFAANGNDFDCGCAGDDCEEKYGIYLVFNNSVDRSEPKPFLGIGNDNWCEGSDCTINTTIIQNGISRFIPQLESFHPEDVDPYWSYTNLTEMTLHSISTGLNENLTQEQGEITGNFSFMFTAEDYVWMSSTMYDSFDAAGSSGPSISVSKTLLNESAIYEGNIVPFLINITNTGQTNITNLIIIDQYDVGLNYTSASIEPNTTDYSNNKTIWDLTAVDLHPNNSQLLYVNFTAISFALLNFNNVNVTAVDEFGNNTTICDSVEDFSISEDENAPSINFTDSTTQTGNYSQNWILANVTANDTESNLDTIVIYLYNSTKGLINSTNSSTSPLFINFTNLADGKYYLNATANDTLGQSNHTEINITLDTIPPDFINLTGKAVSVNETLVHKIYAADVTTNVSCFEVNDTNFTIDCSGNLTNSTALSSGDYILNITVNDTANNKNYGIIHIIVMNSTQTYANETEINITNTTTEVVMDSNSNVTQITIPLDIPSNTTISLNLAALLIDGNVTLGSGNNITLSRETSDYNCSVKIPNGTVISGPSGWDGKIQLPTVNDSTFTISGGSAEAVIDLGSNVELNFSRPAKIVIGGMAGKKAAWTRGNNTLTEITTECNNISNPTNINSTSPRECYINSGNDLVIWTYHFTSFAAYSLADGSSCSNNSECSGGYCVHSVCRSSSTYCGDGYCDSGETCSTCSQDCGTCSSGGGSGGTYIPSYWTTTYLVNDEDFEAGYSKVLSEKKRLRVKVNNESHYVGVVNLTNITVTINVSSIPQQATLSIGEEKNFEVTNDSYYDIYVKLNSITNNTANLTIKKIHEEIPEEIERICTEGTKSCSNNNLQECKDNAWSTTETCEFGCNTTTLICNLKPTEIEKICTEGTKSCYNNNLQECKDNAWSTIETCEFGCNETTLSCNPEPEIEKPNYSRILLIILIIIVFGGGLGYYFGIYKKKNFRVYKKKNQKV